MADDKDTENNVKKLSNFWVLVCAQDLWQRFIFSS